MTGDLAICDISGERKSPNVSTNHKKGIPKAVKIPLGVFGSMTFGLWSLFVIWILRFEICL